MAPTTPGIDTRATQWTPVERLWLLCGAVVALVAFALAAGAGTWIGIIDYFTANGSSFGYHGDVAPLDILKISLPVAVVVGGLVALTLAYHRQQVREASRFAVQSAEAAAELNGGPAAVRIAGVHAVADLADQTNHSLRRQQCIDALCAYLREPYRPVHADRPLQGVGGPADTDVEGDGRAPSARPQERDVRLAIISVIRAHLQRKAPVSWTGYDFDFTGAVFDGGSFRSAEFGDGLVSFRGATFTGGLVSFRQTRFTGGQVFFDGTTFTNGPVSFDQAKFTGARVFFDRARFVDAAVSFDQSRFTSGQVSFDQASFAGGRVTFHEAQLTGAPVSFDRAEFTGGRVSFHRAQFAGGLVSFDQAAFTGGRVFFDRAGLTDGLLSFRNAAFTGGRVSFDGTRLTDGQLSFHGATFASGGVTSFSQAALVGGRVSFHGATIATGALIGFRGADFAAGRITFHHAGFTGGTVDLRYPHSWIQPPRLPDRTPQGLLLPEVSVEDATSPAHATTSLITVDD